MIGENAGSRLNRHSTHPDDGTGEMEEGEEMNGAAVIAGGDAPEVLEFVETALDPVSRLVDLFVVGNDDPAREIARASGRERA